MSLTSNEETKKYNNIRKIKYSTNEKKKNIQSFTLNRVRFFGKIQIRILVSKNGFCVSLPKSENGLITD